MFLKLIDGPVVSKWWSVEIASVSDHKNEDMHFMEILKDWFWRRPLFVP